MHPSGGGGVVVVVGGDWLGVGVVGGDWLGVGVGVGAGWGWGWDLHLQSGDGTRDMVCSPKETPYQSVGDGSSEDDPSKFPYSDTREVCVDPIGRYEQDGGHKVTKPVHSNMASVQGAGGSVMLDHCSYSRNSEQGSRQFVEAQNSADRVDFGSEGGEPFVQFVGQTTDRLVCLRSQFPDSKILLVATELMGVCNECVHDRLVRPDGVCISSDLPNSSGLGTSRNADLCSHSNSSMLAEEAMVFQNNGITNRCSSTSSSVRVAIDTTSDTNFSFQPRPVWPDCMDDFRQEKSATGLSARAEALVEASLHQVARQTYTAKYQRYANWCERRGLDPKSAPLHELVNFLAELEQEELSHSTLGGYRSMSGHVHMPIAGMSMGSSPVLSRLLKGVFNTDPPKCKLCPGWDAEVVLNYLKKEPFVPLGTCSLKFPTLKTCFLLAITSARRADDLSKLSIHPLSCELLTDKAALVPEALLKQDRPSHFMAPIEIRAFQEDEKLCEVHTLKQYLRVVAPLRGQTTSLMVTCNKPHKKPSSQTISRWLVETIKLAYEAAKLSLEHVAGNSTRAFATPWAEFKGMSLADIMKMADWATAGTYFNHYRQNILSDASISVLPCRSEAWKLACCHRVLLVYIPAPCI